MLIKKRDLSNKLQCRAALHLLGDDDVLDESKEFERTDCLTKSANSKSVSHCNQNPVRYETKNHQKSMNKNAYTLAIVIAVSVIIVLIIRKKRQEHSPYWSYSFLATSHGWHLHHCHHTHARTFVM